MAIADACLAKPGEVLTDRVVGVDEGLSVIYDDEPGRIEVGSGDLPRIPVGERADEMRGGDVEERVLVARGGQPWWVPLPVRAWRMQQSHEQA